MNTHFIAKTNSDEIWDTMFFTGLEFNRVKHKKVGGNEYVFITPDFDVVCSGRHVIVDDQKFKYVSQAKQYIWSKVCGW